MNELKKAFKLHKLLTDAYGVACSMDVDLGLEDELQEITLSGGSLCSAAKRLLDYHRDQAGTEKHQVQEEEGDVNMETPVDNPRKLTKKNLKNLKKVEGLVPIETVHLLARECLRHRKLKKRLGELQALCDELQEYVESEEFHSDGLDKREAAISEAAVTACLGDEIWKTINEKQE